jgi:hypothetical protein
MTTNGLVNCSMGSRIGEREVNRRNEGWGGDLSGDSERDEDQVMMAFQVIGAIFLTLFLAAAMSAESTQRR